MILLNRSLRRRLLVLILAPLLVIAAGAVFWRFEVARQTAEDIFDRNLIMLCLAVSRDVAYSGGDSLSQTTTNLLRDASGGDIFYHVYGPDGSFVTGYSSPPVFKNSDGQSFDTPILFNANHLGQPTRAVRLAQQVSIEGISGTSVVTVWQPFEPRQAFAARLARQTAMITSLLLASVAALVFFGIRFGLRPLRDLEAAITQRSSTDLRPIERQIPIEAKGIVSRLNELFARLNEANQAKDRLISNAAHQLRNPIAAVHSMARATLNATTMQEAQSRATDLVRETKRTARLTNQILSFENLSGLSPTLRHGDLVRVVKERAAHFATQALHRNVEFEFRTKHAQVTTAFDQTLIEEALTNVIENALQHGGPTLTLICVDVDCVDGKAIVRISNNGDKIPAQNTAWIFERFAQGQESQGSGLGLAIVAEIMSLHDGDVRLLQHEGTTFEMIFAALDTKARLDVHKNP